MERRSIGGVVAAIFAIGVVLLAAWLVYERFGSPFASAGKDRYQAVFLSNGQVFFGRVGDASRSRVLLHDVHYIQGRINPETKQQSNILVRRGKEWHGPAEMLINAQHILWMEPVGPDSEVQKLIAALRAEK